MILITNQDRDSFYNFNNIVYIKTQANSIFFRIIGREYLSHVAEYENMTQADRAFKSCLEHIKNNESFTFPTQEVMTNKIESMKNRQV